MPCGQRDDFTLMIGRERSGNYRLTPTEQRSQQNSSGITSQINARSSGDNTFEADQLMKDQPQSDSNKNDQLLRNDNADMTPEISYSASLTPVEQKSIEAHNFRSYLQSRNLDGENEYEGVGREQPALEDIQFSSEKSFENDEDSVGEEFSLLINCGDMASERQPCHYQSLKKNSDRYFNNGKLRSKLNEKAEQARPMQLNKYAAPVERQKVRVRGSVVRNNFQQSLQAINYPLHKQGVQFQDPTVKKQQPYLMRLPRGSQIPPVPPKAPRDSLRVSDKTLISTMTQKMNTRDVRRHSKDFQPEQESPLPNRRPLSATQSLSNRFKNGVPIKQNAVLLNSQKQAIPDLPMNQSSSSFVDSVFGAVAMGPKISTNKFSANSDSCRNTGKVLERSLSPSDDGLGLPQVVEFQVDDLQEKKFTIDSKNAEETSKNGSVHFQQNVRMPVHSRPKQPVAPDMLQTREELPFGKETIERQTHHSLGSQSPERCDDSHNISASQLKQQQAIKTISKQSIRAARFDEKRRHEVNQILRASPNHGDNSFNFLASEHPVKDKDLKNINQKLLTHYRRHHLDQNPQLKELRMPQMNLKFVSLNLFSKNLVSVDLSENKIKTLPEEIATIVTMQTLKIDGNQIAVLPKDLWKLQKLKKLFAQNNQIKALPPNFEWLSCLENLTIHDNQLAVLPEKIGLLNQLQKLHLHENRLASLPREMCKLVNLADFSLEWFMYTKPANARVQKNPEVIKSVRDFCQNFQFNPGQARIGGLGSGIGFTRMHQVSIQSEFNIHQDHHSEIGGSNSNNKYVTFSDFIIQYHKIAHSDISQINKIEFTMKKRSLVHQICFNVHKHLLRSLLNLPPDAEPKSTQIKSARHSETSIDQSKVNNIEIQASQTQSVQGKHSLLQHSKDTDNHQSSTSLSDSSGQAVSKVINLSKKDTQGVVPICLLVMNMTPIERKKEKVASRDRASLSPQLVPDGNKNVAKTAANFFSQDFSHQKCKVLNKRRKEMIRLLLECRDANGQLHVDINNQQRNKNPLKSQASTILMSSRDQRDMNQPGKQQQHPVIYWTVFKYQFKLAIELIECYGADPTVLNQNNSNLLHILFANFNNDMKHAKQLAELLIARKVNLNLIDKDGKSPVLVAIKKSQIEALQFAHQHNIVRQSQLQNDPSFAGASQLIRKSVSRLELFDFRMKGRSRTTPLHYVIKKSNYESFMYLIKNQLCDCLARDSDGQSPRLTSLINSAFYRVLIKEERRFVRHQIAMHELQLLRKIQVQSKESPSKTTTPEFSLLCHMLAQNTVVIDSRHHELEPHLKVVPFMEAQKQNSLQKMCKAVSESSVPAILETTSAYFQSQLQSTRIYEPLESGKAKATGRQDYLAAIQKHQSQRDMKAYQNLQQQDYHLLLSAVASSQHRAAYTQLTAHDADLNSSIGSPKVMMFRAPPVQRISIKQNLHIKVQNTQPPAEDRGESPPSPKASQAQKVSQLKTYHFKEEHKISQGQLLVEPKELNSEHRLFESHIETIIDEDTRRVMDAAIQFSMVNFVHQDVFSRRSIHQTEEFQLETTVVNLNQEFLRSSSLGRQNRKSREIEVQARRPFRSSTMRFNEQELMDFTLGNKDQQTSALQLAVQRLQKTSSSSEKDCSLSPESVVSLHQQPKEGNLEMDELFSPSQVPPTVQSTTRKTPNTNLNQADHAYKKTEYMNVDEVATARVLNIESERSYQQQRPGKPAQKDLAAQLSVNNPKYRQLNMFRNMKNWQKLSPNQTSLTNDSDACSAQMRLYEHRAFEMRPLNLKRPYNESPANNMRPQEFDISLPSLPIYDDTQQQNESKSKKLQQKPGEKYQHMAYDDELGQTIKCMHEDEVLQETTPNKTIVNNIRNPCDQKKLLEKNNNLFGYAQNRSIETNKIETEHQYETERVLEGPLVRPHMSSPKSDSRCQMSDQKQETPHYKQDITSPHFNQNEFRLDSAVDNEKNDDSSIRNFLPEEAPHGQEGSAVNLGKGSSDRGQDSQSSGKIFISNMNININLNININVPKERSSISSRNSDVSDHHNVGGTASRIQQTNFDHQHLSTILDEHLLSDDEHRPKPSLGSKVPFQNSNCKVQPYISNRDSLNAPENVKSSSLGSFIESQAKQITQQQILDQLNPKELAQAVQNHIHMQNKSQQPRASNRSSIVESGDRLDQERLNINQYRDYEKKNEKNAMGKTKPLLWHEQITVKGNCQKAQATSSGHLDLPHASGSQQRSIACRPTVRPQPKYPRQYREKTTGSHRQLIVGDNVLLPLEKKNYSQISQSKMSKQSPATARLEQKVPFDDHNETDFLHDSYHIQLSDINRRMTHRPNLQEPSEAFGDDQKMFLSKTPSSSTQQNLPIERKKFHVSNAFLNRQKITNMKEGYHQPLICSSRSEKRSSQQPLACQLMQPPLSSLKDQSNTNQQKSIESEGEVFHTASENIETSVMGMTPAKPEFEQSALKDKQNHRSQLTHLSITGSVSIGEKQGLNKDQILDPHNVPYFYRNQLQRCKNSSQIDLANQPETSEELFQGRAAAQGLRQADMSKLLGESDEKISCRNQRIFGYMLTDNTQQFTQKKGEVEEGDHQQLQCATIMEASFLKSSTSRLIGDQVCDPNKYTLGNIKHDDQQLTIPSLTQQSHFVLNTGVSDLCGHSPINIPKQLAKCTSPAELERKISERPYKASVHHSSAECVALHSGESQRQSLPLKPLTAQSELLMRCEKQLQQNKFLKEFRVICDPSEPEWLKYDILFKKLAPHIFVNNNCTVDSAKSENTGKNDVLMCLELLIEVLTLQPSAILPDLIHLVTKSNLMKARNEMIQSVSVTLTAQREQLIQTKSMSQPGSCSSREQHTTKPIGAFVVKDISQFSTFSLSMAFMESQNAKSIHEIYKKIQLNKFPTISKNLGLFLKNKRESKRSHEKKSDKQKDETNRTQNIPLSLQKRVKISMIAKPQVVEEPMNDSIFTPRETSVSKGRPGKIQHSPNSSIPQHPTMIASQMRQLNAVSMASRPGLHSKLHDRLVDSNIMHSGRNNRNTRKSFLASIKRDYSQPCSIDAAVIVVSRDQPSQIQPIRNIMSPRGFFPNNS